MPDFPVIDAHIHLFDRSKVSYAWMADEWPEIDRPHGMADLDKARNGVEIDKVIVCEVRADPGHHLDEVEYIGELAQADPRVAAMTAWAPMHKGAQVEADIEALKVYPIVRGIRYHLSAVPEPGFDPNLVDAVKIVGRHGLHYELGATPRGLDFAIDLARKCPDVPMVLVHLGSPNVPSGEMDPWRQQIKALSRLDNLVGVKVSGTVSFAGKTWPAERVRPYLDHVLTAFGLDRSMYGSDWPASSFAHAYGDWLDVVDAAVEGASLDEKRKLYRDTAIKIFRLS